MTAPTITLTSTDFSTSSSRKVYASSLSVGLKKNNTVVPIENGNSAAYVQTNSYENPRYTISGVQLLGTSGYLGYADILTLIKLKYGAANAPTMTVTYGTSSTLVGIDGSTTAIKVILDSADFNIDIKDSVDGRIPTLNLTFIETK